MKRFQSLFLAFFALLLTFGFYSAFSLFEKEKPHVAPIKAIAQTGPVKEGLKTLYLEELLGLSVDKPKAIHPKEAEKILQQSPLIKSVSVSHLNPETLYIDYTVRTPLFIIGDVENLALDKEGVTFPLNPFFTPKNLPLLYLGDSYQESKTHLALSLLDLLKEEVGFIDLSKSDDPSLGKREIVVSIDSDLLRLSTKHYAKEIEHYRKLRKHFDGPLIIDLRIPNLAYVHSSKFLHKSDANGNMRR
ncbi:MAG: hypothetical protein KDK76_02790 [Chlamydiia bacterium]|nr:hypothetical protein [Chlamydiia bacterium]